MANSNRVFVSPGVYTSEKDLTFVAQSVGVTTLGLVGEALKGPAFEPILISNFDEFKTYFGSPSPVKDGLGLPKYQLPYVAKSYLQESNQLFVTRVLGLTGYKPDTTYGIKALGGVTVDTTSYTSTSGITMQVGTLDQMDNSTIYAELSGKTSTEGTSITDYILNGTNSSGAYSNGEWFTIGLVDSDVTSGLNQTNKLTSPIGSNNNKDWYNSFYHEATPGDDSTIDAVYSYLFQYEVSTGFTGFNVTKFTYDATLNTEYADAVVCLLRSRGSYISEILTHRVTGSGSISISGANISKVL